MKAALYIRVSTSMQIDKDSLPMQRDDLINYCKYALLIDDYEVFEDAGFSGKDTDRPAYQDMLSRIRNKDFSHLLVWKLDRISRNLLDFASLYDELKKYDVTFISRQEQFDTSSAMGEAMLKIVLVFAELERKLTAERVFATMVSRASKGLFNGGIAPYGYKSPGKKLFPVVDQSEAPTVRLIYDLYEKHESTHKVAEILNSMGLVTRRQCKWGFKTLTEIIRNPFYKGTYRYNYRDMTTQKKKKEKEWLFVEDTHEPIISKEQWDRVNVIMSRNTSKNTAKFRKGVNVHLFSGLVRCAYCNRNMLAQTPNTNKDGYKNSKYRCVSQSLAGINCEANIKSVLDSRIAPVVFQSIADIAQGRKVIAAKANELIEYKINDQIVEVSYDFILKEQDKYQKALNRLNDLYVFSDMSEKEFLIKKTDLEAKLKELKKKKPATVKKIDDDFLKMASYFIINNEFMKRKKINYRTIVDNVDKEMLKEFLNLVIHEIKVADGKVVSITYSNGMVVTE